MNETLSLSLEVHNLVGHKHRGTHAQVTLKYAYPLTPSDS